MVWVAGQHCQTQQNPRIVELNRSRGSFRQFSRTGKVFSHFRAKYPQSSVDIHITHTTDLQGF
ncbi:hypothetical protein H6G34_28975 [Anabaena variabilis FACHB-171]|nr:hypothetical protein [Trichormus variabilis FACHB-171]